MPGFVRSKKDEVKWNKAKKSVSESKSKKEESFSDRDWALVNHIYHNMSKSNSIELSEIDNIVNHLYNTKKLLKARDYEDKDYDPEDISGLSIRDESEDPYADDLSSYDNDELLNEDENIEPEDDESRDVYGQMTGRPSESENEEEPQQEIKPAKNIDQIKSSPESSIESQTINMDPEDYEKLPSEIKKKYKLAVSEEKPKIIPKSTSETQIEPTSRSAVITRKQGQPSSNPSLASLKDEPSFSEKEEMFEPTVEELNALREHTRPWEQRARDTIKLQADPRKNPVLAKEGVLLEATRNAHKDRNQAYSELTNSAAYKNADPIAQMELDEKFHRDWISGNPDHTANAIRAHADAHQIGDEKKKIFDAHKEAQIKTILEGGAMPEETFSTEAGLQHAGGAKSEEGTAGSMVSDPYSSFAMGNKQFVKEYAKNYTDKNKKASSTEDLENYDIGDKKDINRILGPAAAKSPLVEDFFKKYNRLIAINAKNAIKALGLQENHPNVDIGLLHEAGMHGLMQAVNSYDPSKGAQFKTWASRVIKGLQMTALNNQHEIPQSIRRAAKDFNKKRSAQPQMSAPTLTPTSASTTTATPTSTPASASTPSVQKPAAPHVVISESKHPNAPKMAEAIKRIDAQRNVITRKRSE